MRCPTGCDATLVMSERQGVEIDYCPTCRGVWLDRGELDKILERSAAEVSGGPATVAPAPPPAAAPPAPPPPSAGWQQPQVASHRYVDPGSPPPGYGSGKRKKRKGFLEDIFDF